MTDIVDSLNNIATEIVSYVHNNKFSTWAPGAEVNLLDYYDNTVFVKNFINFDGGSVLSMPKSEPGFIVTAGYINASNTIFGDNIVLISNGNITLNTVNAGSPFIYPDPQIANMFWSTQGDIDIQSGCILYSNIVAYNGNVTLSSELHGGIYVGNTITFSSSNCYLEGDFWTTYVNGNTMNAGQIILGATIPNVFAQ